MNNFFDILGFSDFQFVFIFLLFITVAVFVFYIILKMFNTNLSLSVIEKSINEKNYKQALESALRYLKTKPANYLVYYYMGTAYEGLYQYHMAIESYEKSLVQVSETFRQGIGVEIQLKLANLCRIIKKIDSALGYYKMVLAKQPNNKNALWNIAGLYFEQKKFIPAKNCLEKITTLQPKFSKAKMLLAKVYYQLGAYQKSIMELKNFFEVNEEVSLTLGNETSILLADNYIALKRYSDAIATLKPQLNDNNIMGCVLLKIVTCLIKDNKFEEAIAMTDDHLPRIPVQERCGILYTTGQAYKETGEIYKALLVWKAAYNINPKYMDINDIFLLYSRLINNPWLESYYTANDFNFEKYVRKKLKILMENNLIEKQKVFWIFKNGNNCSILYRVPEIMSLLSLERIQDFFDKTGYSNISIDLYTFFGVELEGKEKSLFYKKIREVSDNDFLLVFNKD